ncbi:MAG: hypothetical protein KJ077_11035 [Anaerolineae bacterium]|nr:hypothetical protein [Anaerolineae bacterium]
MTAVTGLPPTAWTVMPFLLVEHEAEIARGDEWLEQMGLRVDLSIDIENLQKCSKLEATLEVLNEAWIAGALTDEEYREKAWPLARQLRFGGEADHAVR